MNYFELFELPVTLKVDKELVKKKYLELSRKYHPDYFVGKGGKEEQHALELSALLNKAFKTFNNKDETIKYTLSLKGLLAEEEKYQLEPGFLMQMMEINEELAELELDENPDKRMQVLQHLQEYEKELYEPVKTTIENYKENFTSKEELLQVKDYYFKKKYIRRLYQQLNGKL
jgi:molecular chaperone HscB